MMNGHAVTNAGWRGGATSEEVLSEGGDVRRVDTPMADRQIKQR